MNPIHFTRRQFVESTVAGVGVLFLPDHLLAAESPADNPTAHMQLAWTDQLRWGNVVDVTRMEGDGKYWDKRLLAAQQLVAKAGGGVIYNKAEAKLIGNKGYE